MGRERWVRHGVGEAPGLLFGVRKKEPPKPSSPIAFQSTSSNESVARAVLQLTTLLFSCTHVLFCADAVLAQLVAFLRAQEVPWEV